MGGIVGENRERTPLSFFFKGLAGLAVLFLVTLPMKPRPEVNYLRAMIGVGFAIVAGKTALRYFGIDWPSRRR